jgi:ATP-dependent Clp protease protease subunit
LAQSGAAGKRYMLPNARHMIHQPSGGAGGQATDMEIQVREILKMKETLTGIYVKHNSKGRTYDQLIQDMERDKFMSAQEALEYGLVDQVVEKRN